MPTSGKRDEMGSSEDIGKIFEELKQLAGGQNVKDLLKQMDGNQALQDVFNQDKKTQDKLKQLAGGQKIKDAFNKLGALSSADKWQNILMLKERNLEELNSFLDSLNSRSLIAFKKKALNNNEDLIAESISLLLENRKKSVNESLASRIQVNFRLSEEDTKAVNKINDWINNKESIPFLDKTISSNDLSSINYLPRLILETSLKYLYFAYLNDTQTDMLAKEIFEYRIIEDQDWEQFCDCADEYTFADPEDGVPMKASLYRDRVYRPRVYNSIMKDLSEKENISIGLLKQFWDEAFKRSTKLKTDHEISLREEELDEISELRAKIFKEFNTKNI